MLNAYELKYFLTVSFSETFQRTRVARRHPERQVWPNTGKLCRGTKVSLDGYIGNHLPPTTTTTTNLPKTVRVTRRRRAVRCRHNKSSVRRFFIKTIECTRVCTV